MISYRYPIRMKTPQHFLYTFKDQDDNVIDLTAYVSVVLELKFQGAVFASVASSFVSPKTAGVVELASQAFTTPGIWDGQFVCTDGTGLKLFGEPIQFKVVKNIEDLDTSELPIY